MTLPEDNGLLEVAYARLYCNQSHHPAGIACWIMEALSCGEDEQLVTDFQTRSLRSASAGKAMFCSASTHASAAASPITSRYERDMMITIVPNAVEA